MKSKQSLYRDRWKLKDHVNACHWNLTTSFKWGKEIVVQIHPTFCYFYVHPISEVKINAHSFASYVGPRCLYGILLYTRLIPARHMF